MDFEAIKWKTATNWTPLRRKGAAVETGASVLLAEVEPQTHLFGAGYTPVETN